MAISDLKSKTLGNTGMHFIVELHGTKLTEPEKRLLDELKPAGILLLAKNFASGPYEVWFPEYCELLEQVRTYIGRREVIVSIDHEGGRVVRPPEPVTRFPYAADWAAQAEVVTKTMAEELCSLAVNMCFTPVLDIHSCPSNPVIGPRAFGTTAEAVISPARKVVAVMREHGIIPCIKHFPGHGDTEQDSHVSYPVVRADEATLRARELLPFQTLIADVVPLVMTAHVLYPALDPENPATFSVRILRDLLRGEFGFQGVVISDAMGMEAAKGRIAADKSAIVRSVRAGCDLFIVAHNVDLAFAKDLALAIHGARHELSFELQDSEARIDYLWQQIVWRDPYPFFSKSA